MALDLNNPPPDEGETLPDLNEKQPEDKDDLFQIHDAHQDDLVGVEITGGQNQIISPGTCLFTYLSYWSTPTSQNSPALDEHHLPDGGGEAIPYLNMQPAHDEEPFHVFVGDDDIATGDEGISADGNGNFDVYGDLFDLNLHASYQPDLDHCKCFCLYVFSSIVCLHAFLLVLNRKYNGLQVKILSEPLGTYMHARE